MDTTMRDLEQIQERDDDAPKRKLAVLALAGLTTFGLVFAVISGMVENTEEPAGVDDPLARLSQKAGLAATPERSDPGSRPQELAAVDPQTLTFPSALTEEQRPEVAAALAAAAAESAHLDPIEEDEESAGAALPSTLPASIAAASSSRAWAREAARDPLVASALPEETPEPTAPHGSEGKYTLQVISYTTATEARTFATALRARGHAAFVVSADIPGRGTHWRVRIGPFDSQRAAEEYRSSFEERERMNTYVVRREPAQT